MILVGNTTEMLNLVDLFEENFVLRSARSKNLEQLDTYTRSTYSSIQSGFKSLTVGTNNNVVIGKK